LVIPGMKEKRKVSLLFTGDYGTGKTETALRVGHAAQRKYGRTFFYLHNADMFQAIIPYLRNYTPAITFIEDIDQISSGDRDTKMNDLLNMLDGNTLKNIDCTFIFTTNNHDKIHPAMRRPGRIDQIVHFGYCTEDMVAKIFKAWAEGIEGWESVDYEAAAKDCPKDLQGAVVAEIARRAIQYAENLHDGIISTERFLDAIASMRHHIEFMKADQRKDHTMENLMGHVFFKAMRKAFPNMGVGKPVRDGDPLPDFEESSYEGLDS
jgi:ATP-dependent 26S proteasome regulatory subunit